jgi:predicted PurR-regulated permease PerM
LNAQAADSSPWLAERPPPPVHLPLPPAVGPIEARPRIGSLARAVWVLAACGVVATLWFGRPVLVPVVLGVLIALVLSGIVETLRRLHIPRVVSSVALLAVVLLALVSAADALWAPSQLWFQRAPRVLRIVEQQLRPAQAVVRQLDSIVTRARTLVTPAAGTAAGPSQSLQAPSAFVMLADTGWFAASAAMTLALALLLLSAGPAWLARAAGALAGRAHGAKTMRMLEAIRLEIGRYYGTLVLINIGFGLVTALAMRLLGVPNPWLWGAVAGVLNFIPYLGCAVTLLLLTLVSLVTFAHGAQTLTVMATFVVLAGVEGHVVEPLFLGRRLKLNPIIVLVALWLGGGLWGVAGVLCAIPVLVAAKVGAAHHPQGEWLVRLLGPGTEPAKLGRPALRASAPAPAPPAV